MTHPSSFIAAEPRCAIASAFMLSAPTSGSGKTTVTMGLLRALRNRGLCVQPFKCGPDYIDTKFHQRVCGRPSINLDTFVASPRHVRDLFCRYGQGADVCVVEGMMGLFDGYDRDRGSSAEIAQTVGLPVVLVVDAKSAAYSTAALLHGFLHFRQQLHIAGVVFNRVGSARHLQMLQEVCDDLQVRCFGYLPKDQALEQGSRYLGLDFSEQIEGDTLARLVEEHIDIDALLALRLPDGHQAGASFSAPHSLKGAADASFIAAEPRCAIAGAAANSSPFMPHASSSKVLVARNGESFSFIYQEKLDGWTDVAFFDPEKDVPQLDDIDLLYLPGGYPEKHLEALAANQAAREAIRAYAERGGRILAECGGMMYLCRDIVTDNGRYPLCGVLPYTIKARTADRKLSLGYRRFQLDGCEYRGHEFHYTQFEGQVPPSAVQVYNAKGEPVPTPVIRYKNVLASYTHIY